MMSNKRPINSTLIHFIQVLLDGTCEISEEEATIRLNCIGMNKLQLPCLVAYVLPCYSSIDYSSKEQLIVEFEQSIRSFLQRGNYVFCINIDSNDNLQIILHTEREANIDELFIQLRNRLHNKFGLDFFIGLGSLVEKYGRIAVSANEAKQVIAYRYQYADKGVVSISNIVCFRYNISYGSEDMYNRVIGCFQNGDLGKMALRLDELISEIRYRPNVSKSSIKRTIIELTVQILHIAANARVDVDELLMGDDPYRWILQQDETPVITEWFMSLAARLQNGIREQQEKSQKRIVRLACEYIEKNLNDNTLGLQAMCEQTGLSAPYFSQLFKKEMNIGLNSYITSRRCERAKELLDTTEMKIEDIALQVGYTRPNYFGNVFRKYTGMSPGNFRKKQ